MATQSNDPKVGKLEQLILQMGVVIRNLDIEKSFRRYWTLGGGPSQSGWVHELEEIKRPQSSASSVAETGPAAEPIKVIIHLDNGNIDDLYSTVDLNYIVINEDELGDEPIILGNLEKPKMVNQELSLQDIEIELDGVEGYDTHPWKGK
ncbi:hypothetical protein [Puia dinghuensis]|uniref:Uncharacterized protein n=1 Tax=Puia dinghuensis TaxID=1792502 RepID=A0A8J2UBP5_9BACT|nr:hypothetical protein [Puia dinghuensis]GGA92780.1 hypothetical protein GCM10011511_15230 [Puia dinghuensis]